MGVVGVDHGGFSKLSEECWKNSGVEAHLPSRRLNRDPGLGQAMGQLTGRRCDNDLADSPGLQLAREQPDLSLSSPPFPSRGDVNNPHSRAWECVGRKRRRIRLGRGRSALAYYFRQQGSEVGQAERLVEVGPVQAFEEGQSVAPDGVPGAEDETRRHPRVAASQLL